MNTSVIRALVLCAIVAGIYVLGNAVAQTVQSAPPPRFEYIDGNGVDLVTGQYVFKMTEGVIGSDEGAVSIQRGQANDFGRTDQWSGTLYKRTVGGTSLMYVQFNTISETFTISGSTYTTTKANGAKLVEVGSGIYEFTASDGTKVSYQANIDDGTNFYPVSGPGCYVADVGTCAIPASITHPNGTSFTLNWDVYSKCVGGYDSELNCLEPAGYFRFDGVTSSTGYSFSFTYATDTPGNFSAPHPNWYKRTGATFTNLVTTPSPLPSVTYSYPSAGVEEVTDMAGRVWRFTTTSNRLTGIRRPGISSDNITIAYHTDGTVSSVTKDGVTTTYSRSVSGTTATMTVTNALSHVTTIVSDLAVGRPTAVTDPLSRTTSYTYDSNARLTRVTFPEGNYVNYTYDARGNVTETRRVAKSGSGLSDLVWSASYPSTCTNPLTCNKPTSTTDPRGNTTTDTTDNTDYTYDSEHGGVLTVSPPLPTTGGIRPQIRLGYTQSNGEYRMTSISACQTGSSCSGGADEAKVTIAYDANGNETSVTRANGTGSLSATISKTYDPLGNLLTVDGPLSGTSDTVRYRYSAGRELIGEISPDPDGGASLKHRAVRRTINSEGLVTKFERGTVDSQSDSDWTGFSPAEVVEIIYDSHARPLTHKLASGSATYALAQRSYNSLGRVECHALRMNPSEFASPPASACTLDTEGIYGKDRITKIIRDAAGQVTQTKAAFGTSDEGNETTVTYSSNGRPITLTDAEGNKSTYEYDGHDRLLKTRFPSTTQGAGTSSTTDYEQLTYDANSNVVSRRLRDIQNLGSVPSIAYAYDNLDRLISKNLPGSELDVTYSYDALSRMTGASQEGNALSFTYDALGRQLTQAGPQGTITSAFDAAGRRTRISHPDGFDVDYDYLVTGEMHKVREENATSGPGVLATYGYDNLGRRTSLTRGNGSVATYSFDPVSRLAQIADNLSGTTHDQTLGFSRNPAGQVTQATRSNDLYAWASHYNVNRNYSSDGLNRYSSIGSAPITPTYDTRGNLTSAGALTSSQTYGYSSENLLTSASGGIAFAYDPLLRLYQTSGGSPGTTRLAYDGANLVAEYDGTNALLRRYVHGAGVDEPLVWYEGSGTSNRRFLHADERGSIVALTDSNGAIIATNSYDEYGIPAAANFGRFQYTGQTWLPEISMYYYKARIYSPTLGRFMQPDPIGYGAGMNMYAYVRSDPVNRSDPAGLEDEEDIEVVGTAVDRPKLTPYTPEVVPAGTVDVSLIGSIDDIAGEDESEEEDCTIGNITVSKRGNSITISGTIEFFKGNPTNHTKIGIPDNVAQIYIGFINGYWTGTFGIYSVTTNMTIGPGGTTAYIGYAQQAGPGTPLYLPEMPANTPTAQDMDHWERVIQHEFGHALGLSMQPENRHLDGGIMSKLGHPKYPRLESHIRKILERCGFVEAG